MNQNEKELIRNLRQAIEELKTGLRTNKPFPKEITEVDPELLELAKEIQTLRERQNQQALFLNALAKGNIDDFPEFYELLPSEFKQLQSALIHLNWQIKQLISGDLSQQVSLMGSFSESFNLLIERLRRLKQLEFDLREANQTRDKIFSIVSHDLRSPFTVILGYSQILSQETTKDNVAEMRLLTQKIYQAANAVFRLLENLLDWALIHRKNIKPNPQKIKIKPLIDNALNTHQANADVKNIQLKNLCKNADFCWADTSFISIVLSNLVSNAIKFSSSGQEIRISCLRENNHLCISVADQGVGISEEKRSHLFDVDENNSTPGTNNEKGSGLGLILCKELIQLSGGKIEVKENQPKGSIFQFCLPLFKD